VAKNKLTRFREINSFPNVIQPHDKYPVPDYFLKGKWAGGHFGNSFPVILELGCGKGEYALELARNNPQKNFIGIDIKGERLWRGAKTAMEEGLPNVAFLRIQAERINHFFAPGEVSGIWLTFPDPQPRKPRQRKRLTSPAFLERYGKILTRKSPIHLKTDNRDLFEYTLQVIRQNKHRLLVHTYNLYGEESQIYEPLVKEIQTYYEKIYLAQDLPIHYLKFVLNPEMI